MTWIERPDSEIYNKYDLKLENFHMDSCYVTIENNLDRTIGLYYLYDDCYKCPYTRYANISAYETVHEYIETLPARKWRFFEQFEQHVFVNDTEDYLCNETYSDFGEFGVYNVTIDDQVGCSKLNTMIEPVNIYLPLAIAAIVFVVIGALYLLGERFYKKLKEKKNNSIELALHHNEPAPKKARIKAIDTFRGISIVIMMFINHGCGGYEMLEHAAWNGLVLGDFVFPWFMWIMGTCIPISMRSQIKKDIPKLTIMRHVLKRSIILFVLGVALNTLGGHIALESIRIFSVLQRFAVCYLVVAAISVTFTQKYDISFTKGKWMPLFRDILILWPQWCVIFLILITYLALIFGLEVEGCGRGYLGPGGIHKYPENYTNCIGGATGYIDKIILGEKHIYQHPTPSKIYLSGSFDPEGFFGCLPSIFQVFLGVQAGSILLEHKTYKGRLIRWFTWAIITGLIGGALCGFTREDGLIPINKNLWSLSYVFVTTCSAFILLSVCYILTDVLTVWSGKPFIFPGMNATIMYVGHMLCYNIFPFHWTIGMWNTHFMRLFEDLWATTLWILISYWLYKIKFFLSL